MHKFTRSALSAAFILAASSLAMGAPLTKAEYKTSKDEISARYKVDHDACKTLSANAKDICVQEAKGKEKVAKAELEDSYSPSERNRYNMRLARADAAYAIAKEKCDDASGNAKDVCRKEAKSVYVAAKADAKLVEKTVDANTTANAKTADARKDAATVKRDAAYAVAKEKCDVLAGDPKAKCIQDAKALYGQL